MIAAAHKEVWDAETEYRHDQVHEYAAEEHAALGCLGTFGRVAGQRTVWAEVVLAPLSYMQGLAERAQGMQSRCTLSKKNASDNTGVHDPITGRVAVRGPEKAHELLTLLRCEWWWDSLL